MKVYEESNTVHCYICNELFSVGENSFRTRKMVSICKLLKRHKSFEEKFQQLRAHSYTTDEEFKSGQEAIVFCCPYIGATILVRRVYTIPFMLLTKKNRWKFSMLLWFMSHTQKASFSYLFIISESFVSLVTGIMVNSGL